MNLYFSIKMAAKLRGVLGSSLVFLRYPESPIYPVIKEYRP